MLSLDPRCHVAGFAVVVVIEMVELCFMDMWSRWTVGRVTCWHSNPLSPSHALCLCHRTAGGYCRISFTRWHTCHRKTLMKLPWDCVIHMLWQCFDRSRDTVTESDARPGVTWKECVIKPLQQKLSRLKRVWMNTMLSSVSAHVCKCYFCLFFSHVFY